VQIKKISMAERVMEIFLFFVAAHEQRGNKPPAAAA